MIEAIAIPLLTRSIDFLIDEVKKILDERRKRRESDSSNKDTENLTLLKIDNEQYNDVISSKIEAMDKKIDESAWNNSEKKIQHLMSLLEIYCRNHYLVKEQYAKWGSALVPPIIVNNLKETEDNVENTIKDLKSILGNVYGKKISVGYF